MKKIFTPGVRNFIAALLLSFGFFWSFNRAQGGLEDYLAADISAPLQNLATVNIPEKDNTIALEAKAVFAFKVSGSGRERTITRVNERAQLPIASLTKLMTAVVVMENGGKYGRETVVKISKAAADQDNVPVFGNLKEGDAFSLARLLQLMLAYSSNDAAYALSEIEGTAAFVGQMNAKAANLGMSETRFFNPNGLDMADGSVNYSSVEDLGLLVKYILKNHPDIFQMSLLQDEFQISNGIRDLNLWSGQALVGGKTGFTDAAGGCMIVVFRGGSDEYAGILLGARSSEARVFEMQKLINFINNAPEAKNSGAISL